MKQGNAGSNTRDFKTEPKAHAMSPGGVSQIGTAVDPKAVESINKGRGFNAPHDSGKDVHPCGSQGRHK